MMQLDLACYECVKEQLDAGAQNAIPISMPLILVNDSGIYKYTCENGHACSALIDSINFEILFEYGLNALVDDYYREAVSSFASSLERYYEFFIKTALYASKNDLKSIKDIWDKMQKQSERQLGAYIVLYSQTFVEQPLVLSNGKSEFRNSVIHKGKIPSKEEAIAFGNAVMHSNEENDLFIRSGDITNRIPQIQESRKPRTYSVKAL